MKSRVVTTAATTSYLKYAERLKRSLPEVEVVEYEDTGEWILNTLYKSLACEVWWIGETDRDLWILDADLECQAPGEIDQLWYLLENADAAIHYHEPSPERQTKDRLVSAGVVGVAPTPLGRAFLAYWAQSCLMEIQAPMLKCRYPEQQLLWEAGEELKKWGGKVARVPLKFNARPLSGGAPWDLVDSEIVLSHLPASRVERNRG